MFHSLSFYVLAQESYRLISYKAVSVHSLEGGASSSGGGPGSDGIIFGYSRSYAVAMTKEGHLIINGDYYGEVSTEIQTNVVVSNGRVFVNGIRRPSETFPKELEKRFFGKPDEALAQTDWSKIFFLKAGPKVFIRDAVNFGASGNNSAAGVGPYVFGMNQDRVFHVWGVSYRQFAESDTIEVYRDRIVINGKVRAPILANLKKR